MTTYCWFKLGESVNIASKLMRAFKLNIGGIWLAQKKWQVMSTSQRTLVRSIRYMEGTVRAGTTSQVTITLPDGSVRELTAKADSEQAIINCNERKCHQTEGGSRLLSLGVVNDLGNFGGAPKINEVRNGS